MHSLAIQLACWLALTGSTAGHPACLIFLQTHLHRLQERKVSPPNLPTPEYFAPLGTLLAFVRAGNKFAPVSVDDIRSGALQYA